MATKKEKVEEIAIAKLNLETIDIHIKGIAPLIVSRFDEKAKQQIVDIGKADTGLKQGGKKKNIANPEEQYRKSLYVFADGVTCGFPAVAFKSAMVTAAYRNYGRPQTVTRSAFHVLADDPATGLVRIYGEHRMREDMVRVGGASKVASPRYRAEFPVWEATLRIQFIQDILSKDDIVTLVNTAGFSCGVGEWRPEKSNSGSFGLFTIAE